MSATSIYLERNSKATLLTRTPYGRDSSAVRAWTGRGLTVVSGDVAGRFDGPGEWLPYGEHEAEDGLTALRQTLRRGVRQPVFLAGASYEAFTALETERAALQDSGIGPQPIAGVLAMVPALGLWETAHDTQGREQLYHRLGWWLEHGFHRYPQQAPTHDELVRRLRPADPQGHRDLFGHDSRLDAHWKRLWDAPPRDLDCWAAPGSAPLLIVTGRGCPLHDHAWRLARHLHARGRNVNVIDGPWGHRLMADIPPATPMGSRLRKSGGLRKHLDQWIERCLRGAPPAGLTTTFTETGQITTTTLPKGPRAA